MDSQIKQTNRGMNSQIQDIYFTELLVAGDENFAWPWTGLFEGTL